MQVKGECSMTTAIEPVQEIALQEATGYQLVATDDAQLRSAHGKMIEWAHVQIATLEAEKRAEEESLAIAKERKWATAAFTRRIAIMDRRITFYRKIEAALRAGYVIVPNFEMTVFAIRTKAKSPRGGEVAQSWRGSDFVQNAQQLPEGEGEYQNPRPQVWQREEKREKADGKTESVKVFWPDDEFKDIEFPIALAKPALMTKTAEAMARRVFDEVGVAVDRTNWSRRGDPIVLGRIVNPRRGASALTFFIGWYFDPSNL
jgi:hypothetical protein